MKEQYLIPGVDVKIFRGEDEEDAGKILEVSARDGKHFLKFQSNNPKIGGPIEFISFSNVNSADNDWFYLFQDPFNCLKKCYSNRGPIYRFKKD